MRKSFCSLFFFFFSVETAVEGLKVLLCNAAVQRCCAELWQSLWDDKHNGTDKHETLCFGTSSLYELDILKALWVVQETVVKNTAMEKNDFYYSNAVEQQIDEKVTSEFHLKINLFFLFFH